MKKNVIILMIVIVMFTSVCFADAAVPENEHLINDSNTNIISYIAIAVVIVIVSCVITTLINKKSKEGNNNEKNLD